MSMKKCPYCAELIQEEAIVCRYCGHDLSGPLRETKPSSAGRVLKVLAKVIYWIAGLYGLAVGLLVIASEWGVGTAIGGFLFFPIVIALVPWYVLIAYGGWTPLLITYGGGILGAVLNSYGQKLSPDE